MKLKRDNKILTLPIKVSRDFYVFLNDKWMFSTDDKTREDFCLDTITNTLVTLGISYSWERNLYEGDDGCMHEVVEIVTQKNNQ